MQIKVQYPVWAKGKPKGMQRERTIYGAVSRDFEVPAVDLVLEPLVFLKGVGTTTEYYSCDDGYCYRKFSFGVAQAGEVPTIRARYGDSDNPVASEALVRNAAFIRSRADSEIETDYYPTTMKKGVGYRHSLTEISPGAFRDLKLDDDSSVKDRVIASARDLVVVNGDLFKRVPEPVYAVSVAKTGSIDYSLVTAPGFHDFEDRLHDERNYGFNQRRIIAVFAVDDRERMLEFIDEIAKEFDFTTKAFPGTLEVNVHGSLKGTGYNLKVLAHAMRRSAIESITKGPLHGQDDYAQRILEWDGEALELFRVLNANQAPENWFSKTRELVDVVNRCREYDAKRATPLFTRKLKDEPGRFYEITWQEWLMSDSEVLAPKF